MRIIGCDLHARQQTLAMLDTTTGEVVEMTLKHEGDNVREFYSSLPRPVRVGIEATGSMQWFLNLMEELGIECQVGHPAQIRACAPRKQKNDRRDAELILKMLVEGRFPAIWLPSKELQDLRALLRHRHQWVRMRTRIQNALQSIALANGLRRGTALWSHDGQNRIASLPLAPHTAYRRSELQAMYEKFEAEIQDLPDRSRTILFDELLDYFLEVWIPCAKAPREPVSATLGNFFASRYYVELASLARLTDSFNV